MRSTFSEKVAHDIAGACGLRVSDTAKTGTLRQMMVGKLVVQHDSHYHGADGWKVGCVHVGHKGDAMAVAAYVQSIYHDSPFTPGTRMAHAFNEIRKARPELRAMA